MVLGQKIVDEHEEIVAPGDESHLWAEELFDSGQDFEMISCKVPGRTLLHWLSVLWYRGMLRETRIDSLLMVSRIVRLAPALLEACQTRFTTTRIEIRSAVLHYGACR